jgi:serine/threonine protein kinase
MPLIISDLPSEAQKALDIFPEFEARTFNDSGANGYVLIGRHRVLRKKVAIKIYFHGKNDIDQEPTIVCSINHENILKVYDARKVEDDCSFFLMDAANEGDLALFLSNHYISTHLSLTLLCQLLSGIAALHAEPNNLVHRDLKPENLLINDDIMLIADFGSIRKINLATGKAPASQHSILYRPPEAFGSNPFFDYSSDVYQAGVIGYLLFGGSLSNILDDHLNRNEKCKLKDIKTTGDGFEISTFYDSCIERKICAKRLLNWNNLPCFVPKNIVSILKKATNSKESRFSNTSEFLAQLLKIRSNFPEWRTNSKGHQLWNWKGMDYLITEEGKEIIVKKKKASSSTYRKEKSLSGASYKEVHAKLRAKIKLP